jgi:hypothetical protein
MQRRLSLILDGTCIDTVVLPRNLGFRAFARYEIAFLWPQDVPYFCIACNSGFQNGITRRCLRLPDGVAGRLGSVLSPARASLPFWPRLL